MAARLRSWSMLTSASTRSSGRGTSRSGAVISKESVGGAYEIFFFEGLVCELSGIVKQLLQGS